MKRINRAIEALQQRRPIYYEGVIDLSFENGRRCAQTWADYLSLDLEHHPFAMTALNEFMRGLIDAGPTASGHRMPAVIVTLPTDGADETMVRHNSWMIKQALAAGVHGLMLCHAESPGAVRAFVEASRYAHQTLGVGEVLGQGRRGSGGQDRAASIWGVSVDEYLDCADVWPLNPNGELMLGVKIENQRALANAEDSLAVPGLAFAEWGPGDMGMTFGFKSAHDPPYPAPMIDARNRVKAACDHAGIAFLDIVNADNIESQLDGGVMIGAGATEAIATKGRRYRERSA